MHINSIKNQEERIFKKGDIVSHFKHDSAIHQNEYLYEIIGVGLHTETNEPMMTYQALYGDKQLYVRPYSMFLELVDKEKYPNATQTYRFEKIKSAEELATGTKADGVKDIVEWLEKQCKEQKNRVEESKRNLEKTKKNCQFEDETCLIDFAEEDVLREETILSTLVSVKKSTEKYKKKLSYQTL